MKETGTIMFNNVDLSSDEERNKEFASIDIAKFICAILVVVIHTSPFGDVSELLNYGVCCYICRIAVPFFFVCTGYFCFRKTKIQGGGMM